MQEALSPTPAPRKLGLLVHPCNLNMLVVEMGGEYQGHLKLGNEFGPTSDALDCIKKTWRFCFFFFFDSPHLPSMFSYSINVWVGCCHLIFKGIWRQGLFIFVVYLFFRKRASLSAEKKHISSHVYYKMAVDQAYIFALDLFLSLPKSIHMLLSIYQPPVAWLPLYSLVDPIHLLFISPSLRSNLSCSFKAISFLREICSASYL